MLRALWSLVSLLLSPDGNATVDLGAGMDPAG